MKVSNAAVAAAMSLAAYLCYAVPGVQAETAPKILRETLRQQSAAGRSTCTGVQRTISAGTDATLVVRTAVELGYNPCQVLRCALEGKTPPDTGKETFCEKVIRGAVAAGVAPDVVSRCSADVCDPAAVAEILAATLLEPNYCYFFAQPLVAPEPSPRPEPVFDRSAPRPQASPFTF